LEEPVVKADATAAVEAVVEPEVLGLLMAEPAEMVAMV
jgi:hypothetical protein